MNYVVRNKINSKTADKSAANIGDNQKYTSLRQIWMKAIMNNTKFTPFDKCVAWIIMNAINDKTRDWKLSDETIAAEIGKPGSTRRVRDSRNRLRDAGWIGWKRTKDANVYFLCHDNVMAAMDEIMLGKAARRERRKAKATSGRLQTATSGRQTYSRTYSEKKENTNSEDIKESGKRKLPEWSTPQIIEVAHDTSVSPQVIKLEEEAAEWYKPKWSPSALMRMPDQLGYLVRLAECSCSTRH